MRGGRARIQSTPWWPLLAGSLALLLVALLAPPSAAAKLKVRVLSNRADMISGGRALVEVKAPRGRRGRKLRVTIRKRGPAKDITRRFRVRRNGRRMGGVRMLGLGRNVITARLGRRRSRAKIVNHPVGGPVFSGPQIQPWKCQKTARTAKCHEPASYTLLYRSTDPSKANLQPYDPKHPPSDVATTTTDQGHTVPFIVRQELGYEDRDQYKILTLFRPGKRWRPWRPQKQWNHKVLVTHGGGCGAGYGSSEAPLADFSGTLPEQPLLKNSYIEALGRGFAVLSTALDNLGHDCNLVTQAESLMMAKERLVEEYGSIRYTIGTGCSGGSVTQQTVANAYPGIYQGLIVTCSYPDVLTPGSQFADYHLLRIYFEDVLARAALGWTPQQWAWVEGHASHVNAVAADEGLFKSAVDPTSDCHGTNDENRYDPDRNPGGARCSILDYSINVLGPRPKREWGPQERKLGRGFAGVPFGNDGIQFGLGALQAGEITPAQFVDLNEKIGGLDIDLHHTSARIRGDRRALRNAYRSGFLNSANNLSGVAIIDHGGPDPGVAHDARLAWTMRDRLEREQGYFTNQVIWYGQEPLIGDSNYPIEALGAMDRWLAAVEHDHARKPLADKIVADRPADLQDRCSAAPLVDLVVVPGVGAVCEQKLVMGRFGTPRTVAGDGNTSDRLRCKLKPLDRNSYGVIEFTDAQWKRLEATFPRGVCDWRRRGVGTRKTVPWLRYGTRKGSHRYGGKPLGAAPPRSGGGWTSRSFNDWRRG